MVPFISIDNNRIFCSKLYSNLHFPFCFVLKPSTLYQIDEPSPSKILICFDYIDIPQNEDKNR